MRGHRYARQPPAENEGGGDEPFAREEFVDATRRHALASRHRGNRQIAVAEVRNHVGYNRPQPRGADVVDTLCYVVDQPLVLGGSPCR